MIFSHLDPVSSTCFGLTCTALHHLHKNLHGVFKLDIIYSRPSSYYPHRKIPITELGEFLQSCAASKWKYDWVRKIFVSGWKARVLDVNG
jgi:hypothetical protein